MNQSIALDEKRARVIGGSVEIIAGEITEVLDEARFSFWLAGGTAGIAIQGRGCVIQPEKGDLVIIHKLADGRCFITDVLTSENMTTTMRFQDGLRLVSNDKLLIKAEKEFDIEVAESMSVESPVVSTKLGQVKVLLDFLDFSFRKLKKVGVEVETRVMRTRLMAQYIFQNAKSYIRTTSDLESTEAGTYSQKVSGMSVSESQYLCLIAEKDARVDGKRIHIG
ncbi:MAG: DUF3540 domain-containing protein [Betaproteobacteria bacterium]|nr:DUF3540 domain-containing protein [Betaproteobacteria bacterium]